VTTARNQAAEHQVQPKSCAIAQPKPEGHPNHTSAATYERVLLRQLGVSRVVQQSSDGRYHREADPEARAIAVQRAGKIENLPATRRYDAIPQQADVVGDGQSTKSLPR
jgi:hypothetical protein